MATLAGLVISKARSFPSLGEAAAFFHVPVSTVQGWLDGGEISVDAAEKSFDIGALTVRQEALWEGRKVCLLFPWYKETNPITAFSIMSFLDRAKMGAMIQFGDAFIAHSRNKLTDSFLKSNCEWALTVDDDMVLPCGNAAWFNSFTGFDLPEWSAGLNSVNRLLSHQKTLVGALYFGRWKKGKPVYAEGGAPREEEWARSGPHDTVKPTRWVGTGCLLIHRSVFLDIEKKFPHLARNADGANGNWFTSSEHDLKESARAVMEVLNDDSVAAEVRIREAKKLMDESEHRSKVNSKLGTGEDVQFCVRATQAGHQPHVDMGLICGHMGSFCFGPKHVGWEKK